jgi:hypothetical protein
MMTARSLQAVLILFVCRLNAGRVYRVPMAFYVAISCANQPTVAGRMWIARTVKFVRMVRVYLG